MRNSYKIIWTDEALNNLKAIIAYLEQNWTLKEIIKFAKLLDKQLVRIQNNPFLFPATSIKNSTRRSVLTKQITIYYRIINYEIHIVTLFDNRQNPKKLKQL
jgi:plasmid stabilization system protein ParE